MKTCPQCHESFEDKMSFCLNDGTALISLEDTLPSNPATFEQTLALPREDNTFDSPVSGEETVNMPYAQAGTPGSSGSFDETMAFSNEDAFEDTLASPRQINFEETMAPPLEPITGQVSEQTKAWQPENSVPPPLPLGNVTENIERETPANNVVITQPTKQTNGSGGKGLFIILGVLLAGFLLIVTALGGWLLFRSTAKDVAVANVNNQSGNSNINSENPNTNSSSSDSNVSDFNIDNNTNVSNPDLTSPLTTDTNQATPKPTPTNAKTLTPTPTPKETPNSTTPTTPTPKTPTPIPSTPTPKPVPDTVSGGVLNGKAISLAKPPYPPAAKSVRASGAVNVQVTIDENGNVISAKAVSGHVLLRGVSESAARSSKFSPTLLSGQRVKVTGVIVYNFIAQ